MKQAIVILLFLCICFSCSFIETRTQEGDANLIALAMRDVNEAKAFLLENSNTYKIEQFSNSRLMIQKNGEFIIEGKGYMYKAIPLMESVPLESCEPSTIKGYLIDGRVVLVSSIPKNKRSLRTVPLGKGDRTILFAWLDWSDKTGNPNPSFATLDARFASLTKTLEDSSFNQLDIVNYTIIAGPIRVSKPSASYVSDHPGLMNEAKTILLSDYGIDADTYDFFGVGFPSIYSWGGMATSGGSRGLFWLNGGYTSDRVFLHEVEDLIQNPSASTPASSASSSSITDVDISVNNNKRKRNLNNSVDEIEVDVDEEDVFDEFESAIEARKLIEEIQQVGIRDNIDLQIKLCKFLSMLQLESESKPEQQDITTKQVIERGIKPLNKNLKESDVSETFLCTQFDKFRLNLLKLQKSNMVKKFSTKTVPPIAAAPTNLTRTTNMLNVNQQVVDKGFIILFGQAVGTDRTINQHNILFFNWLKICMEENPLYNNGKEDGPVSMDIVKDFILYMRKKSYAHSTCYSYSFTIFKLFLMDNQFTDRELNELRNEWIVFHRGLKRVFGCFIYKVTPCLNNDRDTLLNNCNILDFRGALLKCLIHQGRARGCRGDTFQYVTLKHIKFNKYILEKEGKKLLIVDVFMTFRLGLGLGLTKTHGQLLNQPL